MSSLPCLKYDLVACHCPYLGKHGKAKNEHWTCCGLRPVKRVILLEECPQIEVVRSVWVKANKKAPA